MYIQSIVSIFVPLGMTDGFFSFAELKTPQVTFFFLLLFKQEFFKGKSKLESKTNSEQ